MEHLLSSSTALLIIDVQKGFDDPKWGRRNNPDAEANISNLINVWRSEKRPVIHIQHCSVEPDSPLRPELPGCQFKPEAAPIEGEPVFNTDFRAVFNRHTNIRILHSSLLKDQLKTSAIKPCKRLRHSMPRNRS